jgi:hypothetical protein
MRTVNLMILGHGVPLWAWGLIWGVLSLVVAMPSMVGVFVGLSWGRAVRADREGGDASSIPPRAIGWLFVRAWAISVLFIPPAFALLRTPKGTAFGAAVVGFVLSVFLARASVRGLENAAQQRGEQTASAGEGTHNERNE